LSWLSIALTTLVSLLGSASAVAVAAYLGKSLLTNVFARELEKHKSDLALALEQAKHSFQVQALERQIQFTRLHERRADVIATIYSRLDALNRFFRLWLNPFRDSPEVQVDQGHAMALMRELEESYYPHAVWLDRGTCNSLNELIVHYHTVARRFARDVAGQPVAAVEEKWHTLARELTDRIGNEQKLLEDEFRLLLGVHQAPPPPDAG
jgi:hypothetical protein